MNSSITAIVFQDFVQSIQRTRGGNTMSTKTVKSLLLFFAGSVNLHAQPGDEWQPSENTEKPEGAIQNASKLGLLATTPDEGTVLITGLGRVVKEEMNRIFGN